MKKIIAIPLLILYITAMSGMIVKLHFCGDKLSSWKVNETSSVACCCASDKTDDGHARPSFTSEDDCCSNKTITLKVEDYQNKTVDIQYELGLLQLQAPDFSYPVVAFGFPGAENSRVYQSNAPPEGLWQQIPLYKLFSRFTYYG